MSKIPVDKLRVENIKFSKGYPTYYAIKYGSREDLGINKIVGKIPMQQCVIDDKNDLYIYYFNKRKPVFARIGNMLKGADI